MSRQPEGPKYREDKRTGIWFVRFRHKGHRYHLSTQEKKRGPAQAVGSRIFAAITTGQDAASGPHYAAVDLADAFEAFIADYEVTRPVTAPQYEMYGRCYFVPFFERLDGITTRRAEQYKAERLRSVLRSTLKKELSALRVFLRWSHLNGLISDIPIINGPGPREYGTATTKQKRKRVGEAIVLTPEEVSGILAELPERGKKGGWPRAQYEFMWLTGLRIGTVSKLRVPDHYQVGATTLHVGESLDKSRYRRDLPLSRRAREVLDEVAPADDGLIFARHDFRDSLRAAATRAGLRAHRATKLSNHDFRHSFITHLAGRTKDIASVAYLAGHKRVTTTNIYVRPRFEGARDLIDAMDALDDVVAGDVTDTCEDHDERLEETYQDLPDAAE